MNYARVVNDVAVDVYADPYQRFHPDLASQFVEVPLEVEAGWILVDGTWSAPPKPEPELPPDQPTEEPSP